MSSDIDLVILTDEVETEAGSPCAGHPGAADARRHLSSPRMDRHPRTAADFNEIGEGHLPGDLGIEMVSVTGETVRARMVLSPTHLTPHGYLHAASVVALADSACGYGCIAGLPEGSGFTTIELKANYFSTQTTGSLACLATLVHGGRTTQVWDAEVTGEESGRRLALFRCTQLLLSR
jgi:1,4-dihydroxy-2-naphthoyl-CoA hydrolase